MESKRQIFLTYVGSQTQRTWKTTFGVFHLEEKAVRSADSALIAKETKSLPNEDFQVIQELPMAHYFSFILQINSNLLSTKQTKYIRQPRFPSGYQQLHQKELAFSKRTIHHWLNGEFQSFKWKELKKNYWYLEKQTVSSGNNRAHLAALIQFMNRSRDDRFAEWSPWERK